MYLALFCSKKYLFLKEKKQRNEVLCQAENNLLGIADNLLKFKRIHGGIFLPSSCRLTT